MSEAPDSKFAYCICSMDHAEGADHNWTRPKQKMENSKDGIVPRDYDRWGDGLNNLADEMADEWDQYDVDGMADLLNDMNASETLFVRNMDTGETRQYKITLEASFDGYANEVKEETDAVCDRCGNPVMIAGQVLCVTCQREDLFKDEKDG